MKKILTLLLLLPAVAFCNEMDPDDELVYSDTKIVCMKGASLFSALTKYNEIPMLSMLSYRRSEMGQTNYETRLFVNSSTGTWTLVERREGDLYCVSALGEQLKPIMQN